MNIKKLILALSLALPLWADSPFTQTVGPFGGLNTNVSQEALDSTQSPDLLNVDITQGGKSVKKRQGYGLDATLAISTSAVHNMYKFFDASGNEVRLAFNDNRVSSSINGSAWTNFLTTGTVGATWDCTDYLGYAYCVSSAFDNPIKTNGTLAGTTGVGGTNAVPAGSLVSNSGDRLLVGATAANPSRLYYSQSAVFSNFTLGVQPSDSSYEDIVAPGSKLTHLAYHFGRWLWWKDQSFGFIVGTGQFDLQIITVSNTIGTLDNTDVFDGNYVYFRGSDSQIYTYDGSTLSRAISVDISPTLRSINRRKANSWTQSTQTDFSAGISTPTLNVSTSTNPGNIVFNGIFGNETSSSSWSLGSVVNMTVNPSSITLSTNNSGNVNNNSFESGSPNPSNWTVSSFEETNNVSPSDGCRNIVSGYNGSIFMWGIAYQNTSFSPRLIVSVIDANTQSTLDSQTYSLGSSNVCALATQTFSVSSSNIGRRVKFKFLETDDYGSTIDDSMQTDSSYILGGNVTFLLGKTIAGGAITALVDFVQGGSSTITSGSFTSQVYDTYFSSSSIELSTFSWTANTSTPTFSIQTATATTGIWSTLTSSSGTFVIGNRYARYVSTVSVSSSDNALTSITAAVLVRSTGTYYSAVNNSPALTSWNTFSVNDQPYDGTLAYYIRSSTSIFSVTSTTPAWVSQIKNGTVSASTGTYFQAKVDFSITSATQTPTLNDFTFNWFEGSAADKMYGTYFNNGIWFSVSIGTTSSTNNRIFRYDLISNLWTLYDIPANGFATYNNGLYFGDPVAGKINQFGNNVTSDNGAAINAYWKSKAFFGDSPFNDKDLRLASWYIGESSGTTLNLTYTLDESSTITKSINLFDSRRNVIQNNWNFPLGSIATNFNIQFGDNSTGPGWEVFGGVITGVSRPWKVNP